MELKHMLQDGALTVAPAGRLDSATSDSFSEYILSLFTEDIKTLIIDFSEIDFISSKGLRVLVALYKQLNGRKMVLTGANSSVMEIFRISGFLKVFDIQ